MYAPSGCSNVLWSAVKVPMNCTHRLLSFLVGFSLGNVTFEFIWPDAFSASSDKSLWVKFMDTLTADHKTLLQPLGAYISPPHAKLRWKYDEGTESLLFANNDNTAHELYVPRTGDRMIRSGLVYDRERTVNEPAQGTHYATVTSHGVDRVKLHSKAFKYVRTTPPDTFLFMAYVEIGRAS